MTHAMPGAQAARELPNYTRERGFVRLFGMIPLVSGLNVLITALLDPSSGPADPVSIVLDIVSVSVGALCLLVAALLLCWPRPRAWLSGTTLETKNLFQHRRVDIATARLGVRQHVLIATAPSPRRTARLPLVRPGDALPPPDLMALADAIQGAVQSNPAPQHAWQLANGLRELATNEALRDDLGRRVRTQHIVLTLVLGTLLVLATLLLGLRIFLFFD